MFENHLHRNPYIVQFHNNCFRSNQRSANFSAAFIIVKPSYWKRLLIDGFNWLNIFVRLTSVRVWIKLSMECKHNLFYRIEVLILETNNSNANNIIKRWINIRRGTFDFLPLFRRFCSRDIARKLHFLWFWKFINCLGESTCYHHDSVEMKRVEINMIRDTL